MSGYRFSRRAEADLRELAEFGVSRWGEKAALAYVDQLEKACALIARMPSIARRCDSVRPGYFRFEVGSHVLFLVRDDRGIKIVRVLRKSMLPVIEEEDEAEPAAVAESSDE